MPKWVTRRWPSYSNWALYLFMMIVGIILFFVSWPFSVIFTLICLGIGFYLYNIEAKQKNELISYISKITHRVKRTSHEVINELPFGIILYDEDKKIEWHNPYVGKMMGREHMIGEYIVAQWPALKIFKDKDATVDIVISNKTYKLINKPEERIIYVQDITSYTLLAKKYEEDKFVLGFMVLDNIDEVTQGLDDQTRSILMAQVTTVISEWSARHQVYLRRMSSDRFILLMSNKELASLEQSRFDLLDDVKDATRHLKLPMTLSIGIAGGYIDFIELGQATQTSLDIALSRGGDQVAVKIGDRVNFYGGRSNAVEKRTRVRARVVSHALRDLIKASENVVIMGHKLPDIDSIGAAIGIIRAADILDIPAYIVLEGINPSIERLMDIIREDEELATRFISPTNAIEMMNKRTLAVVVDTHKATFVAEPKLLSLTKQIVVIDHHRRGEDFIQDATLIYMEPYASSTCELVTELLQYIDERIAIGVLESTILLAGIVTDTKSFSVRTGSRTFEAASYLRRSGADSTLIQRLLKDDLEDYLKKANIIRYAQILHKCYAIAVTAAGERHSQLLIAQVADTLLNMQGIEASFVVSERPDGLIGISARSMGQVNVQLIMEQMGGGGHLTNAAAQIEGTILQGKEKLITLLQEYKEREGVVE
jgi:c-di-AMP phosphodiesterase-like protein